MRAVPAISHWLWAIPVFGIIILVHELGHFLAAKAFGIRVHDFAIGFGPPIASFRRGETRYSLRLFLILGGFVRMAGMEDGDLDDPRGFNARPVWQRIVTIAAGPLMNFALAVVLVAGVLALRGYQTWLPVIGRVVPGYPAEAAGLRPGDRVVAVDGQPVRFYADLVQAVVESGGRPMTLRVLRAGQPLTVTVQPVQGDGGRWQIGVVADTTAVTTVRLAPGEALREGVIWTGGVMREILRGLGRLVTGRETPQVQGPLGITRTIAEHAREGIDDLVRLSALLSINIGIINLLPFPALDGSRIAFLLVEAVRRRRVSPQRENLIHFVGLVLLLGLMAVITYSEIVRWQGG